MFKANYPVDNQSDYREISIQSLLGSFSGRDIKASSKQREAFFTS